VCTCMLLTFGVPLILYLAPEEKNWVFGKSVEAQSRVLLKSDSFEHMKNSNFVIRPSGKIWKSLCKQFDVRTDPQGKRSILNIHIHCI